ncbi:MAG TPA: hypothetical protein VIR45_02830 [Kiloniellaceae bacterium]
MSAYWTTGSQKSDWSQLSLVKFPQKNQGDPDLLADRQTPGRPALALPQRTENSVRYEGVELDDNLAIAERVDV